MGGKPVAPPATRKGKTGVAADCSLAAYTRGVRQSDLTRAKLLQRPCPTNELSDHGRSRLADRQWGSRIRLSPKTMSPETSRPVLDSSRTASLGCFGRS